MTEERSSRDSVLDAFEVELLSALQPYAESVHFAAGERIFAAGEPSDAFYIVDEGDVRLEVRSNEMDTDNVLDHAGPGSFFGDVSVLSGAPRWLNAYADTDVAAREISSTGLRRLVDEDPEQAIAILRSLGRDAALKYRSASARLGEHLAADAPDPEVERMVATAGEAQKSFAPWDEQRVDALLEDIAQSVAAQAEELARSTVEETTLGSVGDKVFKIQFASLGVFGSISGRTASGPVSELPDRKVTEIASPVGVIFALVPVTNPVPTFVNKTLIALKGRNSIILSSHRMAQATTTAVGDLVIVVLERHGAPEGLVQWVRGRTNRNRTAKFMSHEGVHLILATGGPSMVKAAYSAGTPAIGVGAGNAPAWVAPDADVTRVARLVINSKTFDNGLICGAEQHLVVDASVHDPFVEALEGEGAMVLDADATRAFVDTCFDEIGHLKLPYVGRTAETIASAADIEANEGVKLLVFSALPELPEQTFGKERLAPVLSLFKVDGDDEALALCKRLLTYEGAGHTAVIHTEDTGRRERFAEEMPASRILVNAPASQGCSGVVTGLAPSLTLGCGTFGGNSTTDNVSYQNLLNIKRMAESLM